jgi:hypothetical protein
MVSPFGYILLVIKKAALDRPIEHLQLLDINERRGTLIA